MIHRADPNWGSHIPMLVKVLPKTIGSVLELGMGISSTPILHALCADQGKVLISLENEKHFVDMFRKYNTVSHDIYLVNDWDKVPHSKHGIVLVDHKPDHRRKVEALKFKDSEFVILHDTEPENDDLYRYSEIYPEFKYRFDYKKFKIHTTVLSNTYDLNFLHST